MIEFDDRDLRKLQDVDGIVLQDVHGKRVAIGRGFDYENIFQFMSAYFEEYGAEDFAKKLAIKMLRTCLRHGSRVFHLMKVTLWIGYVSHLLELTQIHFNKNV